MTAFDSERLLDDVGWRILEALQENARVSYSDLGREVGRSALGLPITALIRVAASGELCARLAALVREMPEVRWCQRVTGDDSCVMQVAAASVAHLEAIITRVARRGRSAGPLRPSRRTAV